MPYREVLRVMQTNAQINNEPEYIAAAVGGLLEWIFNERTAVWMNHSAHDTCSNLKPRHRG